MSLVEELKRRKVFKVGAAYLVVAWLAVQAASIAFPAFEAPPWALRVFILVALLGFPVALVMAWVFEVTPEGVERAAGTSGTRWVVAGATALGLLALGWYYFGQPSFRKDDPATPVAAAATSLAVLPFANLSGDPKEDYFSDGMTEELLNVLAKVPRLQVVARTSVFEFKGKGGDIRQIGRKLGVSHIVEGSVRRDGDQVRIKAQLVRVADGFTVWSQTYERKLVGVFALQDEIAARVGSQLVASLVTTPTGPARAAVDPVAYDEYLKGRALLRAREDLPQAIAHFRAATQRAPGLAAAWSSLSLACEAVFSFERMPPALQQEMMSCQAEGAQRAAALAPNAAITEHALGTFARSRFRFAEAERHYLRALRIDPGYPDAREDYAELLFQVGRVEESGREAERLVTLDPYFIVGWYRMRDVAIALDRRADVEAVSRKMRTAFPERDVSKFVPLIYALDYGRRDEAHAALAELQARWPDDVGAASVLVPWALGDPGVDPAAVKTALEGQSLAPLYFILRRDVANYTAAMEREGATALGYYFARLASSKPAGLEMLRDPRVKANLVKYGFVAYWREKGWPPVCRPLGEADFECGR